MRPGGRMVMLSVLHPGERRFDSDPGLALGRSRKGAPFFFSTRIRIGLCPKQLLTSRCGFATNLSRIRLSCDMAQGKTPTARKTITFSVATLRYLEALARKGTHGSDVASVARALVEQGVRDAIEKGYLDRPDIA
jgi:hypothetical protein